VGPDSRAAAAVRQEVADQTGHRLALEVEALPESGITSTQGLARALSERGVPTPGGGNVWTHTTVARLLARVGPGRLTSLAASR
jgi:Recombinase